MSKLQLLYEKLMRIFYIFWGIFFLLSIIDFSAAMMTGAFSCSSGTCGVGEEYPFFKLTLVPFIIATLVFFITGYVFFKLAHKESDLLTVSDYKKSLENSQEESEDVISREELYEKLRRGNRKPTVQKESFFKKVGKSISQFFTNIKDKFAEMKESRSKQQAELKAQQEETIKIEEQRVEKEKLERARTKLNKTALILLLSKNTDLTQQNSRLFINSFLDVVKESVISGEEVKIGKFGRFEKVHVEEHVEVDPLTEKEITIEAHNTVEFYAYKQFLEKLNEGLEVVEEPEKVIPEVVEEVKEEPKEEPKEETAPEVVEKVKEESKEKDVPKVVEKAKEEPKKETAPEVVEEVKEEPKEKDVPKVVEKAKEEVVEKPKPVKPKKTAVSVKTKKQIIEMMDETTDLSKNKANKFLKFFAEVVKEQLIKREDVELDGIGFFTTIEMPAKEAVNPQTNEKIIVPAHHQVRLRFNEELKDKMNEQK